MVYENFMLFTMINVAIHDAFVICSETSSSNHLSYRLDLVKDLVLTHKAVIPTSPGIGRPPISSLPKSFVERNFTEKIPLAGREAKLQR
jgi:hypothetical protein